MFPSFEIPEPQVTGQQTQITTPNLNVPSGTIVTNQSQNVSSTASGYNASLPTAERNKIIEEFLRR